MSGSLAGTGTLVRLALRRDRVMLPLWIAVFVVMAASSADATVGLYPDTTSRVQAAEVINGTPSLVALYGRIYDVTSLGAIAMIKMGGIGSALLAVVAFMVVIRHTRAEEETGRLELVSGGAVGRHAPLTAALACAVGAALTTGVLTAAALTAVGLPPAGSVAFGLAWAATGMVFAGVGAVAAQLTTGARAARGLAGATLALAYVLRAVGDSAGGQDPMWLSWSSPIGWGQQVRPYAGDRWAILVLLVAFSALCASAAFLLAGRRDYGAGLVADRPGPAEAAATLRSPLALAWRLHRPTLLAWSSGLALMGLVLGNVAGDVGGFMSSPQARELITALGGVENLTDAFIAAELGFVALFTTAFGIQAALRLHAEETSLRLEGILATGVARTRWAGSHTTMALLGPVVLLLVAGVTVGLAHAAGTGGLGDLGASVLGAAVYLPAVWVTVGLVVAVYGVAPRAVPSGWAALVGFLLLGELGPLLDLPGWAMDLSPFTHVPRIPGGDLHVVPLLWLLLVAAALVTAGLAGFRRRDLTGR